MLWKKISKRRFNQFQNKAKISNRKLKLLKQVTRHSRIQLNHNEELLILYKIQCSSKLIKQRNSLKIRLSGFQTSQLIQIKELSKWKRAWLRQKSN